jgi:hypothetical protein
MPTSRKQVNVLLPSELYQALRKNAFQAEMTISALIRSRLTPMKEEDFLSQVVDHEKGKPTLEKILLLLRRIGVWPKPGTI